MLSRVNYLMYDTKHLSINTLIIIIYHLLQLYFDVFAKYGHK